MIFRLIILNGERRGERITVTAEPMRIGREEGSEIRFNDPEIASLHAEITHRKDGLLIRDLGSMNRILVNNHETHEAVLKHGDVVEVGRTRFLVQAYVQAEVLGEEQQARRRLWKNIAIGVTLVAIIALAVHRCGRMPPVPDRPVRAKKKEAPTAKIALVPRGSPTPAVTNIPPAPPQESKPEGQTAAKPQPAPVTAPPAEEPPETATTPPPQEEPEELKEAESLLKKTSGADSASEEVDRARREIEAAAQALLQSKAREMLDNARTAASNQSPEEAEHTIAGIQQLAPDFTEAYADRARILTARGWLDPAITQWQEVARRAPQGSPLASQAADELKRLAEAREHFIFPFTGRIKILAPELTKFPETAAHKELRVLSFSLEAGHQEKEIQQNAVQVTVLFYDRNPATGLIRASSAATTPPALPQGPWLSGTRKPVSASYMIQAGTQRSDQFYGCLIRVHYHGALQDEWMQPRDLPADVQMAPPARSAGSAPQP